MDIKIDENSHRPDPTIFQRLKNALWGIIMAVVLAQVIQFSGPIVLMYKWYFWLFVAICGFLGWLRGDEFLGWINREIGHWNPW